MKTNEIVGNFLAMDGKPLNEQTGAKARKLQSAIAVAKRQRLTMTESRVIKHIRKNLDRIVSATRSEAYDTAVINIEDKERFERLQKEFAHYESMRHTEQCRQELEKNQDADWDEFSAKFAQAAAEANKDPLLRSLSVERRCTMVQRRKEVQKPEKKTVLSGAEVLGMSFSAMPFTGEWKKLLGKPSTTAKILVYGKPGNGKSTFAFNFARYLSKDCGKKTLYVAAEERFSATLKDKIERLDCDNGNLFFVEDLPVNWSELKQYDAVFIDSVNFMDLTPEDLRSLPDGVMYFYVFQTTKSGVFRGSQEYSHDVDVVLKADKFVVNVDKNRFGGGEPMKIQTEIKN